MSDFKKVAELNDIPAGESRVFEVDGENVAVCNVDGKLFAVADICSHDYASLGEGELDDHQIICPRHGARFDVRTGKALCLPAVLPIPTYEVEVRNGEVWVSEQPKAKA